MKKTLMCAFLAFTLTSISHVQAGNKKSLTTKGEEYFSEKTLNELIDVFKDDPRLKRDPKNGKDLIDKTRSILQPHIGEKSKELWSKNCGIDPTFYNYARALV